MKLSTRVWAIILLILPILVWVLWSIVWVVYLLVQLWAWADFTNSLSTMLQNPDPVWFERASIIALVLLWASILWLILVIKAIGYSQTAPELSIRRWWSLMRKSFWRRVTVLIVWFVVIFLVSTLYDIYFSGPSPLISPSNTWFHVWYIWWMLIQIVLSALFSIIILWFAIDIVQWVALSRWYGKHFNRSGRIVNWIIAQIVYNLVVWFWFLLLVIPGIYRAIRFAFWKMFVIDKWYGPIQALRASWTITRGHRWEVALFKVYEGLIQIPWLLLLWLWLFATIPTGILAYADFYEKLWIKSGKFWFAASWAKWEAIETADASSNSTDSDDVGWEIPFDDSWEDDWEETPKNTLQ